MIPTRVRSNMRIDRTKQQGRYCPYANPHRPSEINSIKGTQTTSSHNTNFDVTSVFHCQTLPRRKRRPASSNCAVKTHIPMADPYHTPQTAPAYLIAPPPLKSLAPAQPIFTIPPLELPQSAWNQDNQHYGGQYNQGAAHGAGGA